MNEQQDHSMDCIRYAMNNRGPMRRPSIPLRCIRWLWARIAAGWRAFSDGVRWVLTGRRRLLARTLPAGEAPLDGPPTYDPDEVQRETTGQQVEVLTNPAHDPRATAQIVAHVSIHKSGTMESGKLIFAPDWLPMVVTKYTVRGPVGAPMWKFGCYPARCVEMPVAGEPEKDENGELTGVIPTAGTKKTYVAAVDGFIFPAWWRQRHVQQVQALMHYLRERLRATAVFESHRGVLDQ